MSHLMINNNLYMVMDKFKITYQRKYKQIQLCLNKSNFIFNF